MFWCCGVHAVHESGGKWKNRVCMYEYVSSPISAFSSLQFLACLFLSVSACSLLIPPPPPSMQCEGTFVSEAWRLCSGAVHLQLDEHLTPESFYTELPRAFAQAHIWTQKKTHGNAFHRNPVAHGTSPLLRTASCESACMCLCACEAVMTFRDCLPHSVSLSFTPSLSCLLSYFRIPFSRLCCHVNHWNVFSFKSMFLSRTRSVYSQTFFSFSTSSSSKATCLSAISSFSHCMPLSLSPSLCFFLSHPPSFLFILLRQTECCSIHWVR